jgi:adenosylhomocysteine nucleosidase
MSLTVITGLAAEARIAVAMHVTMIVGAGRAERLAADLEAAIARGARRLLSFGIAGGLAPQLQAGDLIIAEHVRDGARRLSCDPAWRMAMSGKLQGSSWRAQPDECPAPGLKNNLERSTSSGMFRFDRNDGWRPIADMDGQSPLAEIAGVDAPIADAVGKTALFSATGAAAVDMESAIVARAARRHGLPFAILRVIADPAHRPLPSAALVAMRADGEVDLAAVLGALIRNPNQLPALTRLARDSGGAFSSLVRARALLGADFASADLGDLAGHSLSGAIGPSRQYSAHPSQRRQISPRQGRQDFCQVDAASSHSATT